MKYLKKISALMLVIILLLSFAACKGKDFTVIQLKDQVLVQGIGIDMNESQFEVTLQVLDISKAGVSAGDTKGNITTTFTSTGKSISAAISNGQKVLDRDTFLAQNKIIVMSEEVAEKHLDQVLDFFARAKNCRPDVQVAITTDKAKEIMESDCKGVTIPAEKIHASLINGEFNGKSVNPLIMNIMNDYKNQLSGTYLPVVKLFDKGKNVSLSGIAVFSEGQSIGYLDDRETRGLLWTTGRVRNGTIMIETENLGKVTLRIIKSKAHPKVSVVNERIVYSLSLECYCNLNELESGIQVAITEEDLQEIRKKVQAAIRSEVEDALEKCLREYRCDAFRIGRMLSQTHFKFYKKVKDSYLDQLPFIQYDISVSAKVKQLNNQMFDEKN